LIWKGLTGDDDVSRLFFSCHKQPQQATTIRTLLSFVNDNTRKKFIVTGDTNVVCETLQWDPAKVMNAGGVQAYVHAHETSALE
jgi:hypothetical protein